LVAVQQQQRRIRGIDLKDRACEARDGLVLAGAAPRSALSDGSRMLSPNGVDCFKIVVRFEAPKYDTIACTSDDVSSWSPSVPSKAG
jgi:hypothetical protein